MGKIFMPKYLGPKGEFDLVVLQTAENDFGKLFQMRKYEKTCLLKTKTRTEMSVQLKNQKVWNKTSTSPTSTNGRRRGCPRPVDDTLQRLFGTEQRSGGFCQDGHEVVALGAGHGQVSERGGVRACMCTCMYVCVRPCACMCTRVCLCVCACTFMFLIGERTPRYDNA